VYIKIKKFGKTDAISAFILQNFSRPGKKTSSGYQKQLQKNPISANDLKEIFPDISLFEQADFELSIRLGKKSK
jgi:hypothetical protein